MSTFLARLVIQAAAGSLHAERRDQRGPAAAPCRPVAHSAARGRQQLAGLQKHRELSISRQVASAGLFGIFATAEFEDVSEMEEGIVLPPLDDDALEQETRWLAGIIKLWLDEEWGPQPPHKLIGEVAAEHYRSLRAGGEDDLGNVVLGLSTHLLSVDFSDTFVNGFEIANKVSEVLMLRMGREVCCVSPADLKLADRYAALCAKEAAAGDKKN